MAGRSRRSVRDEWVNFGDRMAVYNRDIGKRLANSELRKQRAAAAQSAKARTFSERYQDLILPEPNTGCWLWIGSTNTRGYGRIYVNGKTRPAHRLCYELLRGSIPPGLHLDHLCRVPCCVNPAHLEPVTCAENIRRGQTGKWQTKGGRCAKTA